MGSENYKILFILVDGIGELGLNDHNMKTTLQATNLPNFDKIAKYGLNGLLDPVDIGLACGSDTAHLSIFGYNPFKEYKGRGSFETMGSGLNMKPGEIGFKCNFAYMTDDKTVLKRRVDRDFPQWGLSLIDSLNQIQLEKFPQYKIEAQHATEHRIGLKIYGPQFLSNEITGSDPLKDNLKLRQIYPQIDEAKFTSEVVNEVDLKIQQTLKDHIINIQRKQNNLPQANVVLLRGCGARLNIQQFKEKHNLNGFMIAPTAIIQGIGQTIGLDIINAEGATGDYHSNYISKIETARKHLFQDNQYQFCFLHIKAVDEAGHDKSLEKRVKYLLKVEEMIQNLVEKEKNNCLIVLTGDHTTPVKYGDHSYHTVPFSICQLKDIQNNNLQSKFRDSVEFYSEIDCAQGALGRFTGNQIFNIIKNFSKQVF